MKKQLRKLTLNRETLAPIQSEQLTGVAGGATPSLVFTAAVAISAVFCFPTPVK